MSWQNPPLGAVTIDYRGARFLLGRTNEGYALWDATSGGAPLERYPLSAEGWQAAWVAYLEREGQLAQSQAQASSGAPAATATWRRGQPLAMAPMRVGQLLDGAFKLYRMHFRTLAPAVALVVVPFQALALMLTLSTLEPMLIAPQLSDATVEQPATWTGVVISGLQFLVITPFLTATVVQIAADAFLGRDTGVGKAYRVAMRRAPSILWVTFLIVLAVVVIVSPVIVLVTMAALTGEEAAAGIALLLALVAAVPAVFVALRWIFATSIVVVEGGRGTGALRRSWSLARGLTGKILGTMLLTGLIVYALFLIVGIILVVILLPSADTLLRGGDVGGGFYALAQSLNAVVTILTTPFLTLVIVLLYFDARMRKEGFDLEVMADQLGERA